MAESELVRIDPNVADAESLYRLPGIGPVMAQRIVSARPFAGAKDLERVNGIGPTVLQRLDPFLAFSSDGTPPSVSEHQVSEAEDQPEIYADVDAVESGAADTLPADLEAIEAKIASPVLSDVLGDDEEDVELAESAPAPTPSAAGAETERTQPEGAPPDISDVPEEDTEDVEPAEPAPTPSPMGVEAARTQPEGVTRGRLLWTVAIGSLFAFVLALVLSLGIIASINGGTLQYALPSQVSDLQVRIEGVENRAESLGQDVAGLRTRLNNLEALSGRVDTLEESAQQLRSDIDATSTSLDDLSEQVGTLANEATALKGRVSDVESEVETLKGLTDRFGAFLDGLRDLLETVFQSEGNAP